MDKQIHTPVLLNEVLNELNIFGGMSYLDCTIGYGGHFEAIYNKANKDGLFIGIDQDNTAFEYCTNKFKNCNNVYLYKSNFVNFDKEITQPLSFDAILLDLGISSLQIDQKDRGFSYQQDAILDMRMNQDQTWSAKDVINKVSKQELVQIFKEYGQCNKAEGVANLICLRRKNKLIETTFELRDLIYEVYKSNNLNRKNPAKQYFQALRIYVNDEINVLKNALNKLVKTLKPNGTIGVITFHSLEEQIVSDLFHTLSAKNMTLINIPGNLDEPEYKLKTKKAILPTQQEITQNKRSHSAKLFVLLKK